MGSSLSLTHSVKNIPRRSSAGEIQLPAFVLILGLLLASIASGDVVTPHPEAAKLHAVFDKHWNREMSEYPTWASQLGDRRFNSNWTDLSAEGRTRRRN